MPLAPVAIGGLSSAAIATWQRHWRVLLGVSAVGAALAGPLSVPSLLPLATGTGSPGWGATLLAALGQFLGGTLTLTALPLTAFFLYVDQRIRRERYDLHLAYEAQHPGPPGFPSAP